MFCCTLLCVRSSIAIILMGKRELVALLNWSSWCLVMVERLFLAVPQGCLRFVIVVFPDHTHYFLVGKKILYWGVSTVLLRLWVLCLGNFSEFFLEKEHLDVLIILLSIAGTDIL